MWYEVILVLHVLSAVISVGAVSVVDYLHIVGMRQKKLERNSAKIYPLISKLINLAFVFIILSGVIMVFLKPEILEREIFRLKMIMVLVVGLNGIYLQKKVAPNLDRCVLKGTKYCTREVLYSSVFGGVFSVVTWFGILILSLTKNLGYTWKQFLLGYVVVLFFGLIVAFIMERSARKWR